MFERIETPRLLLRKPLLSDAELIFVRYASDPQVTRLLSWPTHTSVAVTREFLELSDAEWSRWPAGPYLIESREGGRLLGSTGLHFEVPDRAVTGYVLAQDSWGKGYATEALRAIVDISRLMDVAQLSALCHPGNAASRRVLEKCGFECRELLPNSSNFPNLNANILYDVLFYSLRLR